MYYEEVSPRQLYIALQDLPVYACPLASERIQKIGKLYVLRVIREKDVPGQLS